MKIDISVTMYENGDKPTVLQNEKAPFDDEAFCERNATVDPSNSTIADAPYFYNGRYAMSGGYFSLPRSFTRDSLWLNLPLTYRMIFLVILDHVAYASMALDDHGKKIIIKPGQLLTTERQIAQWCESPEINRCTVQRSLARFRSVGFSIQETIHQKTVITIVRKDILDLIDPRFDPRSIQDRSKIDPEKNKENKENKENNINPLNPPMGESSLCSPKNKSSSKKKEKPAEEEKDAIREFVFLTKKQYQTRLDEYGLDFFNAMLDRLDAYKGTHGKKYKSDYHALAKSYWVYEETKKEFDVKTTYKSIPECIKSVFQDGKDYKGYRCNISTSDICFTAGNFSFGLKYEDKGFKEQLESFCRKKGIEERI